MSDDQEQLESTSESSDLHEESTPSAVDAGDTPVASVVPGTGTTHDEPDAPDSFDAVVAPDASGTPDVSDAPDALDEPAVADVPAGPGPVDETDVSETPSANEANDTPDAPHRRKAEKLPKEARPKKSLSYTTRVVLAFFGVTVFTVIISLGMIAIIWGQFFASYAASNIESIAQQVAGRIGDSYQKTLTLHGDSMLPAEQIVEHSEELGIIVVDSSGQKVFDSTSALSDADAARQGPSAATQIAIAPIEVSGRTVGNVRVWVYGSNVLMSKIDQKFQRDTLLALVFAGLFSLVFAVALGGFMGRTFVKPINKIMQTTRDLSSGDLTARTGMTGSNEMSRLGETIDGMAEAFERDRKLEKQLTSDVAHELRTPLMAIQANVEAMIDGVFERDDEHLQLVDSEVQRLSKLVDALLKLSRLEMRSQPMRQDVVNLSELADDVVISHQAFIEDSGLTILCDAAPDIKVIGDADMIKQAVANLVSNAVRYTDEGGTITVSVGSEGMSAFISVADTGIGLSEEDIKMVFSRFWRADAGRAKESGGLGIGLSLVREIVDRHQGRVAVQGEKGVGATFTLYFPLYDEERSVAQAKLAVKALERRL